MRAPFRRDQPPQAGRAKALYLWLTRWRLACPSTLTRERESNPFSWARRRGLLQRDLELGAGGTAQDAVRLTGAHASALNPDPVPPTTFQHPGHAPISICAGAGAGADSPPAARAFRAPASHPPSLPTRCRTTPSIMRPSRGTGTDIHMQRPE